MTYLKSSKYVELSRYSLTIMYVFDEKLFWLLLLTSGELIYFKAMFFILILSYWQLI